MTLFKTKLQSAVHKTEQNNETQIKSDYVFYICN